MISLGGGMPNSATFPFQSMKVECRDGSEIRLESKDLEVGLQYSPTPGLPELSSWLFQLQQREHSPPDCPGGMERSLAITTGSQDGLSKAFDMLLDSEDSLLLESPTYSGSLAYLQPKGCRLVEVETDAFGLIPEKLQHILEHWDSSKGKRPRVLYTIPTGGNPTGASLTNARKQRIYELASRFHLLILEDDPYYYLRLDDHRSNHPSFLHLDTQARVLRFDSLSKVLSSGMRIGFVTGPKYLIHRINLHTQASNLHPSGLSQAIALALLRRWGTEGWDRHVESVCSFYRSQRDAFLNSAEKHLTGLVEWTKPDAGMFVWMSLNGVDDTQELIEKKAVENKVILVPGSVFLPNPRPSSYVRAAYSTPSKEDMDLALQRLAKLLN